MTGSKRIWSDKLYKAGISACRSLTTNSKVRTTNHLWSHFFYYYSEGRNAEEGKEAKLLSPTSLAGHKMTVTGKRGAAFEIETSRAAPCVLFFGGFRPMRRHCTAVWRCSRCKGLSLRISGAVLFSGLCRIAGKAANAPCRRRIRHIPWPCLRPVRFLCGAWPGTQ